MDTLHDRLAALADDAPRGGAPAAEIWARGTRAHRRRVAALAAVVLVVGAVGAGIGVRMVDRGTHRSAPPPAAPVHVGLPIRYPAGASLPALDAAPGRLAAIWVVPRAGRGAPDVVGLVAGTETFGTLPIDVSPTAYDAPDAYFALSPDGRRIAYTSATGSLVVRDLVSGERSSPAFGFAIRPGYTWVDGTHLVGHRAEGSDIDGWVWRPGTAPRQVDLRTYPGSPWLGSQAGRDPWFLTRQEGDSGPCPSLPDPGGAPLPVLCDDVGVIGREIALTHDGDGAVLALDVRDFADPARRHMVALAGAPRRVTFATDLIGASLDAAGGSS